MALLLQLLFAENNFKQMRRIPGTRDAAFTHKGRIINIGQLVSDGSKMLYNGTI